MTVVEPAPPAVPVAASWVTDALALTWRVDDDPYTVGIEALVGLALRDNPKRAHLVVSKVLAKHVPARPGTVRAAGLLLAGLVHERLGGSPHLGLSGNLLTDPSRTAEVASLAVASLDAEPLVIGFCETATGLGATVADAFTGATYVHTTRHPDPSSPVALGFDEEHSHAVAHHLQPVPADHLDRDAPVVLVDDELTTGTTALNTIEKLLQLRRYPRFVIATLLDLRSDSAREAFDARAASLGVQVDVVALVSGCLVLPDDALERAAPLQEQLRSWAPPRRAVVAPEVVEWPAGVALTARHGLVPSGRSALDDAVRSVAAFVPSSGRVLVLGTEECMAAAIRVAHALELRGVDVLVQSTTRSPILPHDAPGYAVTRALSFRCPTDQGRDSFLYNVLPPGSSLETYDRVVVVSDASAAALRPLAEVVQPFSREPVVLVAPPPARFGSYPAEDVTWLLTDLSQVDLEVGTEDREDLIQGGRPYYEMLPVEFQPDESYVRLFDTVLRESAPRLARAVGLVCELVLDRTPSPVLVSLARAGTPVGVLMRRWYARRGLETPHYTISIVRGGGIDTAALDDILSRHPASQVQFVDGWTGKGAIQRELTEALATYRSDRPHARALSDELAVLADPGSCTPLHGTRDDFLIPSACLNSTVSGLVSRTVLRPDLIRPGMFHGAKFYAELAPHDRSNDFVDAVCGRYDDVQDDVLAGVAAHRAADRRATWSGWTEVERIAQEHGLSNLHLVKPGVGETTRVLLRRVPWLVLVRPDRAAELEHVRLLAAARGVAVLERPDLGFSCVGLIRPKGASS